MDLLPPFPGFAPDALLFLQDLAANNEREWFQSRKDTFVALLQEPLQELAAEMVMATRDAEFPLRGDPKKSLFRIYRDTRFSANKAPYKTHVSAYLSPGGTRDEHGGLYMHIEPAKTFLATGWWQPDGPMLRAFRAYIAQHEMEVVDLLEHLAEHGLAFDASAQLKRIPKGYEAWAGSPIADVLRLTSYTISRPLPDDTLLTPRLIQEARAFWDVVAPFVELGKAAERGVAG